MDLTGKTVVLKFYADWCQPCKVLSPIVDKVALATGVDVQEVDVDADEETRVQFGVRSVPTLVLVRDGQPVDQLIGSKSEAAVLEFFYKAVSV